MSLLSTLDQDQLRAFLLDAAKLWLAHDGLWFQAAEQTHGMSEAIALDAAAWERFTVIEATRIMKRLGLSPGGGLDSLEIALNHRLYALLNEQSSERTDDGRLIFRMHGCRVQNARRRKGLPDFPCKSVGLVEYAQFARTIDERIATTCLLCPPDDHPEDTFCVWVFSLTQS